MNVKQTYELKNDFIKCASKQTIIRIVLPTVFFGVVSTAFLISAIMFSLEKNQKYFFIFIAAVFFIFFILYILKIIKGEKVYIAKRGKSIIYNYVTKKEFTDILKSYDI